MVEIDNLFRVQGHQIRLLQEKDTEKLQEFLVKCTDYSLLVDGYPPGPTAAASLFSDYPEGKTADDLVLIGIYNNVDSLVGILHTVRDYPQSGAWWIGLFLIDPVFRNTGLGRMTIRSFEGWLSTLGARGILLGVVEKNEKALRFWQSVGFEVVARQPPRKFGELTHVVITMAYDLAQVNRD